MSSRFWKTQKEALKASKFLVKHGFIGWADRIGPSKNKKIWAFIIIAEETKKGRRRR